MKHGVESSVLIQALYNFKWMTGVGKGGVRPGMGERRLMKGSNTQPSYSMPLNWRTFQILRQCKDVEATLSRSPFIALAVTATIGVSLFGPSCCRIASVACPPPRAAPSLFRPAVVRRRDVAGEKQAARLQLVCSAHWQYRIRHESDQTRY